jgi:archaellin
MFQVSKIQDGLFGIVGFKQPFNPEYAILDSENLESKSGLFVTDIPHVKIEYLKDNLDFRLSTSEEINQYLKDLQKTAITNVCNDVFSEYDFSDRNLIFKNALNKVNVETLLFGFIGEKIQVTKEPNKAFSINRVILDFQGTGEIELLLFNTGKKEPLQTKVIEITTDNQVEELNWICDNSETTYKGDYYVGYNVINNDLKPYKRDYNNANLRSEITGLFIESVYVKNHNSNEIFNLDLVDGNSLSTGLNFDISVFNDYTDFILNNKRLFAKAIQINFAINCLQTYLSSIRSNANQRDSIDLYQKIMIEIEGTRGEDSLIPVKGLRSEMLGEISKLKREVLKLQQGFSKKGLLLNTTLR